MTQENNNQPYTKKDLVGEVDKDKELAFLVKDFKEGLTESKPLLVCSNCYSVFEVTEKNLKTLLDRLHLEPTDFDRDKFYLEVDKCSACEPEAENMNLKLKNYPS